MDSKIYPVILAGGSGTRLWPRSREKHPKQFMPIEGGKSLFQEACLRFSDKTLFTSPFIVTNEEYRFLVRDQLREMNIEAQILTEPEAKNTAAACISAAHFIQSTQGDVPVLFSPSDQLITNDEKLLDAIREILPVVTDGYLCLLGIRPQHPHSGYGYILKGESIGETTFIVKEFIEKPSLEKAEQFISEGAYWNTGIYFCLTSTLLEEAKTYANELHETIKGLLPGIKRDALGFHIIPREEYKKINSISIDKAITEPTQKKAVVDTQIGWKDLGSWMSLYEQFEKNENLNVIRGDTVVLETKDSYIESNSRLVTAFGLSGMGVIETADAVMVFPLKESEAVKALVGKLSEKKRGELIVHTNVHRPWGEYQVLGKDAKFQVKKIMVLPGAELSLQRHQRRAEHWVVISGVATVTRGEEIFELRENESTYIPMNTIHRLQNNTDSPVFLIETQTGDYFGEDDIERLQDCYGRA